MKKPGTAMAVYAIYMVGMLLLNALIFITPVLEMQGNSAAPALYTAFAPFCHQLTSRSLCISAQGAITDCTPQNGVPSYSHAVVVHLDDYILGYKFPVCSRDVAIYLAMLIGGILYPFLWKIETEEIPNKWFLVLALIPIAIDGTTQLFTLRESTNTLRLITGAIAGFAIPFYLLPMLNMAAGNIRSYLPHSRKK
ncbi:Uncharacterised protein [Candidatus Anstonella stagnisolia]|nr:Uncharacterised protein [Candidatus Anstonella stagnisolia]